MELYENEALTFSVTAGHSLRDAFEDPDPERIEETGKTLKPLSKHIMENRVLTGDLIFTEHAFSTCTHNDDVGISAASLAGPA